MDAACHFAATAPRSRWVAAVRAAFGALLGAAMLLPSHAQADNSTALPPRLSDTGLFVAGSTTRVRSGVLPFAPRHALWSDGADKRRWIALPPGTAIDA